MNAVVMRPYAGESDLLAMQSLLREAPSPYDIYPTASDLADLLDPTVSGTADHSAVWEDATENVVGFAIVSQFQNLHARFNPREWIEEAGAELIGWAVEHVRLLAGGAVIVTLDAAARDDDCLMCNFLRDHGFLASGESTMHMTRSLSDPLPDVELPLGFTIRPLRGDSEASAYVSIHRAAYNTEMMTEEHRISLMRQPHYRQDLDLVAVAPAGALAAFCVSSIDPVENERRGQNEGEIAIVGTHPAYRGHGLGRAVVLAGMHGLRRDGAETAVLGVAGDNTAAIRVYERLGFSVDSQIRWYEKPVDSATC